MYNCTDNVDSLAVHTAAGAKPGPVRPETHPSQHLVSSSYYLSVIISLSVSVLLDLSLSLSLSLSVTLPVLSDLSVCLSGLEIRAANI